MYNNSIITDLLSGLYNGHQCNNNSFIPQGCTIIILFTPHYTLITDLLPKVIQCTTMQQYTIYTHQGCTMYNNAIITDSFHRVKQSHKNNIVVQ